MGKGSRRGSWPQWPTRKRGRRNWQRPACHSRHKQPEPGFRRPKLAGKSRWLGLRWRATGCRWDAFGLALKVVSGGTGPAPGLDRVEIAEAALQSRLELADRGVASFKSSWATIRMAAMWWRRTCRWDPIESRPACLPTWCTDVPIWWRPSGTCWQPMPESPRLRLSSDPVSA